MKRLLPFLCVVLGFAASLARGADELFDRLDEALTLSLFEDEVRARLSGTLDLEGYYLSRPAQGLIDTTRTKLFNPRLTLFLDTQLGGKVYAFAQARLDRGFDPSQSQARLRLDEYAARVTPWDDGRITLEVGKFGTVVGTWVERHQSWENPFINAPLPYENVTNVSYLETPLSARDFSQSPITAANKYEYLPIIWGPSYTTGAALSGRIGTLEYAVEVKNAALGSPPEAWDLDSSGFQRPSVNGRIGYRPDQTWRFGFSASDGAYLEESPSLLLPSGRSLGHYHEQLLAQDISFAWRHWQIWAEFFESRYEVPTIGNADSFAYYVEAKYKLTPQLFVALRWNQQLYGEFRDSPNGTLPAGPDVTRIDAALGYRFTADTQLKLQYSHQEGSLGPNFLGAQFTIRF